MISDDGTLPEPMHEGQSKPRFQDIEGIPQVAGYDWLLGQCPPADLPETQDPKLSFLLSL